MATEITLLEIDAPNAQFHAPFSGGMRSRSGDRPGTSDGEGGHDDTETGKTRWRRFVPLLLVLGLAVTAVVLRAGRERLLEDHQTGPDEA